MIWGTFDHAKREDHDNDRFFASMGKLLTIRKKLEPHPHVSKDDQAVLDDIHKHVRLHDWKHSQLECPECRGKMVALKIALHDEVKLELDHCATCRGFWLDHGELSMLTHLKVDVPGHDLAHRDVRRICPVCQAHMVEYQFTRHCNLMIDECPVEHGVYLQENELDRVFEAALIQQGHAQ